ncbi:hypothetical protein ACH4Q6_32105 [Streptomyces lydicus]|uniref:hypothetical protein n=1 Tax=Streptomyces lydicus TaxID=47763 RepID=UPI00378F9745
MTVSKLLRPVLATVLLASVTACGASTVPDGPANTPTGSASAEPRRSAHAAPVAAIVPDVIGGNAGRAYEQMSSELDMTFKDASGRGRTVDDPAGWKICGSQPGPNQRITQFPVIFKVMKVTEGCKGAAPQ